MALSEYQKFVKSFMLSHPNIPAKQRMSAAAAAWRLKKGGLKGGSLGMVKGSGIFDSFMTGGSLAGFDRDDLHRLSGKYHNYTYDKYKDDVDIPELVENIKRKMAHGGKMKKVRGRGIVGDVRHKVTDLYDDNIDDLTNAYDDARRYLRGGKLGMANPIYAVKGGKLPMVKGSGFFDDFLHGVSGTLDVGTKLLPFLPLMA